MTSFFVLSTNTEGARSRRRATLALGCTWLWFTARKAALADAIEGAEDMEDTLSSDEENENPDTSEERELGRELFGEGGETGSMMWNEPRVGVGETIVVLDIMVNISSASSSSWSDSSNCCARVRDLARARAEVTVARRDAWIVDAVRSGAGACQTVAFLSPALTVTKVESMTSSKGVPPSTEIHSDHWTPEAIQAA